VSGAHTILVVEDHGDLRAIYSTALSMEGFRVRQAIDGLAALHYLDGEPLPDLIVLDLFLPGVSGFVVQEELAARSDLRDIPTVVVTAATCEQTRNLHASCILYKPIMPNELVTTVRRCLRRAGR
jgi:putative two-component system response regulator